MPRSVAYLPTLLCLAIEAAFVAADHQIRFFQGDSISYLSTDGAYMPPDRSWAFGFGINRLLHVTHSHVAFIVIQAVLLVAVLPLCAVFFPPALRWRQAAYAAAAALVCLDPMLNLYVRFYMTDLLACLLLVAFLCCLCRALRASRRGFLAWLPALAALMTAAVFIRVSCAAVVMVTVVIAAGGAALHRQLVLRRLAAVLVLPLLAAALLTAANSAVFAGRFPGEHFVSKSSAVFLMGVCAPALTAADFRAAGVPVSDADIQGLDLPNYDKRGAQIWGSDERAAQVLIKRRLGVSEDYTARMDRVCSQIVWHALQRDPLAIARVYANTLVMQFQPDQWRRYLDGEIGLTRTLPPGFVGWVNHVSHEPITTDVTQALSPVLVVFRWFAPAYAGLLLAWLLIAGWRLVAGHTEIEMVVLSAGLIAVLAVAPLYEVYVIPRYLMPAVFLGYLLSAETAARLWWRTPARASLLQPDRLPAG